MLSGRHPRLEPVVLLRYHSLVTKYGKLEPLAEIDLRPRNRALVEVRCEDKVEEVKVFLLPGSSVVAMMSITVEIRRSVGLGPEMQNVSLCQLSIRLDQTVAELKKQLTTVVQLSTSSMRIYYIDKGSAFGPEEMKYNTRAVHSYSIQDGDEILVVPKTK